MHTDGVTEIRNIRVEQFLGGWRFAEYLKSLGLKGAADNRHQRVKVC